VIRVWGLTSFLEVFADPGFVVAVEGTYLLPAWEFMRHRVVKPAFLLLAMSERAHLAQAATSI